MQNGTYMPDHFESRKNTKASLYTILICGALLLLFLFVTWGQPAEPQPPVEDGIEVNLGNSDQGMGANQPYLPGQPSAEDKEKYTPPKQAVVEKVPVKDVETDDNNKEDAPVIKKPPVTKPNATKIPDKDITKTKTKPVKQPETLPEKPQPRPKAVFHGVNGTGTGGNGADDYKPGGNQGIAGGHGDQGAPGGNPNSNNYTGGGKGNSGVSIKSGLQGRYFTRVYNYQGDFNDNATVAVDVTVDQSGNVIEAAYNPKGSTTSLAYYRETAIDMIKKSKLNTNPNGGDDQHGTVSVHFTVRRN